VPTWAEELLSRLEASATDLDAPVEAAARTVFLLNQAAVPATKAAITYLLLRRVDDSVEERQAAVGEALGWLDDNNYVFEESDDEPVSYRLLTEQEVSVAEKVEERADTISYPRLRSTIMEWIREYGSLLKAPDNRQEVDIGGERGVPLTFYYSVLASVPDPSDQADTVALRVLVETADGDSQVQEWRKKNGKSPSLEDGLIVLRLPPNFERRLRRHVATGDVLQNETRHFPDLKSDHLREERALREALRTALDDARIVDAQSDKHYGTYADGLAPFVAQEVVPRKFPERRSLTGALVPIENGPVLARFFRGDAEWPLDDADARTLGVNTAAHAFGEDGWASDFWSVAQDRSSGGLLDGDQVLAMIEQRGGPFLGTSVEALQALLLALAASETIQLRRDGSLVRDPAEMGRALRTKTQIRDLTIRLEPPPDRDAARRLRTVHRLLTGREATPDDMADIADEIAEWAQAHVGEVQSVQQFVEQAFENVAIQALTERLKQAAADPSSVDAAAFSEENIKAEAKSFRRAYRFRRGDQTDLWEQFVKERDDLTANAPMEKVTRKLENATKENVPEPSTLRSLLQDVQAYRERQKNEMPDSGEDEDYETGDDATPETDLEDFTEKFGPDDTDETKKRLETLVDRLNEEAAGRIVLVQSNST